MSGDIALTLAVAPVFDAATGDDPQRALDRSLRHAVILVSALIVVIALMASVIKVTGAVIGEGRLSVESSVKRVAHPSGGVVAELFVRDGDRVRKGQPIMRFDNRVSGDSAASLGQSLEQLLAAEARLTAERDGASTVRYPQALGASTAASARLAMAEADRLFVARRSLRATEQGAIRERIYQAQQEVAATSAQLQGAENQRSFLIPELEALRGLYARQLVTVARVNQLERTAAELNGTIGSLKARIAEKRARIAELGQVAIEAERNGRVQAGQELASVVAQLGDQRVRSIAATDASERSLLRAPYDGVIDNLTYQTVGGVVPAAQTIMEIVPDSEPLIVNVAVSPADIDQLHQGQAATIRFSAFSAQTTPELTGSVFYIGADRKSYERSGAPFYDVRLRVPEAEVRRLGAVKLKVGMPVEAYMQTQRRSLLSYLVKPLVDQFNRAFRQ
ncbi:HlyD family type I secretion periplasmic adaptor subunit [Sphingomonas mucosissima]|uniref:Membrane fusion protein (MFP) family protein n=1 Tax=Sphingomonas mucosissima TaxID=370959 RepID=A0A245ZQT9_9SPHN|nr:HlyD family type I secretion periplasmic adaptor subunit [Sphingomonas mucosissima]OWK32106.1 type I secretion system membrane fusion protein PrsE [Sphingomonas mucosissima]